MKGYLLPAFAVAAALAALLSFRAWAADAGAGAKVLLDFEQEADAKQVKAGDEHITVAIDPSHATSGKQSLKVVCKKDNEYGSFDFVGDAVKGWDKYKFLVMDLTTDQAVDVRVAPEVRDDKSTDYQTRSTIEEGVGPVKKGKTTLVVDLSKFQRNDQSGPMDLTKITSFRLIFFTKDLKEDLTVYLDNVRLTNEEPK